MAIDPSAMGMTPGSAPPPDPSGAGMGMPMPSAPPQQMPMHKRRAKVHSGKRGARRNVVRRKSASSRRR